ncbi:glutamate-rich protein 6-like isoform 2-T3 [Spinachia spinachia]
MRSSSLYAAAKLTQDVSEPSSVLDHRISDPPTYWIRAAGVLRYNREPEHHRINFANTHSLVQTENPVKCEYCGEKAQPSLDLTWAQVAETVPLSCCAQRRQLCEMLLEERCDDPTTPKNQPDKEIDKLIFKGKQMEGQNKFPVESHRGPGIKVEGSVKDRSIQHPDAEPSVSTSEVLGFRLSCAGLNGGWRVYAYGETEKDSKMKGKEKWSAPFCDHNPLPFGICRHQNRAEVWQKYYSNGLTFLTLFPDGSAQVFYPSGALALVVVVTEENGRVCIVFDDNGASCRPIRAMFQSDGRATCYHSNKNIWYRMTLGRSGGQCLDEAGARVRRWSWSGASNTPTPLYPVFLSLNKTIGIRVLGRGRVFLSFLARGQQARFSVGGCRAQGEP